MEVVSETIKQIQETIYNLASFDLSDWLSNYCHFSLNLNSIFLSDCWKNEKERDGGGDQ